MALPYWLGIAGWMGHVLTCEADTENSSGCATIRTACRGGWVIGAARECPSEEHQRRGPLMKESVHRHETRTEREARAGKLHPAVPVPMGTRKHPSVPLPESACADLHQLLAIEHRGGGRDRHWGRLRLLANSHTLGASLTIGGACHIFRPAMQDGDGSTDESTVRVSRGSQ